jgi:hypothetical protein
MQNKKDNDQEITELEKNYVKIIKGLEDRIIWEVNNNRSQDEIYNTVKVIQNACAKYIQEKTWIEILNNLDDTSKNQ